MARAIIMHVEDQIHIRDLTRSICNDLGYQYVGIASSTRAKEVLADTTVDFILSDISMPESDDAGISFLRDLRSMSDFRGVPVIMLTNSRDEIRIRSALDCGADDYLVKPFKPSRLLQALERWSRVVGAGINWSNLSDSQAKLMRATLGSLGHAFDHVSRGGEPPLELLKNNCAELLQAAADDHLVGMLGSLRQSYARSFAHSLKMAGYLAFWAHTTRANWERMKDLATAGLLHDIGVSRIEPEFLEKAKLTKTEQRWYNLTHVKHNQEIIAELTEKFSRESASLLHAICCHHHERLDGSGPLGLSADSLSTEARLAAIIDLYLDLRTPRLQGQPPAPKAECIEQLRNTPGLDGDLIEAFTALFDAI